MLRQFQLTTLALFSLGLIFSNQAIGANEGQNALDKAMETKLAATTLSDLTAVIKLCEEAMSKGLDEANEQFAKNLLSSTLLQRAQIVMKTIMRGPGVDPKWPQYRRLALTDLEKALKLEPNQPQGLYLAAQLNLLPGGNVKRATEMIDRLASLEDVDPLLKSKALALRAGMQAGDKEKQLADLDESIRLEPNQIATIRARALIHASMQNWDKALVDFNTAIKLDPSNKLVYEAKALVLAGMGKYKEAIACLDEADKLIPNSISTYTCRARIYLMQKKPKEALECLEKAHDKEPKNISVLLLRADVLQKLGQNKKSLADVDEVLKIRPNFIPAIQFRAILLSDDGKIAEAISTLQKILQDKPDDLITKLQLGMLYSANGQVKKALEIFSSILADHPDDATALRGRGDALLGLGKHKEAVADYEKTLKLQPNEPGLLNNMAWVLCTSPDKDVRDGKRSTELAKKAAEITDYKQVHILSTLAAAYAEMGDFKSAIEWVKKGLAIASPEEKEPLSKELKSYEKDKPWREDLSESQNAKDKEVEKPEEPKLKESTSTK